MIADGTALQVAGCPATKKLAAGLPPQGSMNVVDRPGCPPLSPQEGWPSDGHQVLHFQPCRYYRWSRVLEMTLGEVMPSGEPPLLKHRRELSREQAIKLWGQKRQEGWRASPPQWIPQKPLRA